MLCLTFLRRLNKHIENNSKTAKINFAALKHCIILKSVFFLDCTKSAQVRIIKINFLCLLSSYFLNIQPKFSQKGKSIAPNTVKYFQEHRRKGYSKIKRFAFRFKISSYLKFLSSKIIYIQV